MYQQPQQQFYPGQPVQGQPVQQFPQGQVMQGMAMGMHQGPHDFQKMPVCEVPPEVRSDFVRKVYTLLTMQLAVTFGIAFYMNTQLTPQWVVEHTMIYYAASFGTLFLMLAVSCCCAEQMRIFPMNYIFLIAITLGMSVMVGFATVMYTTESVLLALGTTAAVFFVLTIYAMTTKTDFTGMGPYLVAGLVALSLFGLGIMLFGWLTGTSLMGSTIHKVYAGCGVLLFTFYIIYDTQLIIGGAHKKHQFSVDDYVFACINLYMDIINMFMFLLELMGDRR